MTLSKPPLEGFGDDRQVSGADVPPLAHALSRHLARDNGHPKPVVCRGESVCCQRTGRVCEGEGEGRILHRFQPFFGQNALPRVPLLPRIVSSVGGTSLQDVVKIRPVLWFNRARVALCLA